MMGDTWVNEAGCDGWHWSQTSPDPNSKTRSRWKRDEVEKGERIRNRTDDHTWIHKLKTSSLREGKVDGEASKKQGRA